jgi:lyso-ornithine lipid O-acyltransferase
LISRLSAACRAVCFVGVTLPLMPLQWLLIKFWPSMARQLPHHYHTLCCRILGFNAVISGKLPEGGQCLIVSNHVSWIDIVVLSTIAPLSFVAKREVAAWPFFGWLAKLQRTVFVDRERRHSTKHSRTEMEERLSNGERIVLFPEGTSHDGTSVLPFKSSFFAAAASPEVAVVPVTLAYARHWNLPLTRRNRPRFAWYADMALIPHLWEAICAGPLTVQIVIHSALDAPTRADRKLAALTSQRVIRESLAAALHGRLVLE